MTMDFFGNAMDSTVEFFGNISDWLNDNLPDAAPLPAIVGIAVATIIAIVTMA